MSNVYSNPGQGSSNDGTRGGDNRPDQQVNPGMGSSGGEIQGRADGMPPPPTYLGQQAHQSLQPYQVPPPVGHMSQPATQQGQPPVMGGYFQQQPMAFQQMPSMPNYMGYPQQAWYPQPQAQPSFQPVPQITRYHEPEQMEVDDQGRPRPPTPPAPAPPVQNRQPTRHADDRQASYASSSRRPSAHDGLVASLLDRLEAAGIHRDFCDFLDDGMAQLVITQLLDGYEGVRTELERVKAREGAMAEQLSLARKRPALSSPDRGEGSSSRPTKMQQTAARRQDRSPSESRYAERREARSDYRRADVEPRRYDRRSEFDQRRPDRHPDHDARRDERPLDYGGRREGRGERGAREMRPLPARDMNRSASTSSTSVVASPQEPRGLPLPPTLPLPTPDESRVRNPERGGKKEPSSRYTMPAEAPAPPQVMVQPPSPPPPAPKEKRTEPYGSPESDNGASSQSEDEEVAKKKAPGREQHRANLARKAENENPGRIPDELGVVFIENRHERDNRFWDMLGRVFYVSPTQNRVYAMESAARNADRELGSGQEGLPTPGRLYAVVPRGFPMNPREVDQLLVMINERSTRVTDQERVEGYMLLREFRRVSLSVAPHMRDRAMVRVSADEFRNIRRPIDGRSPLWRTPTIRRPGNAFEYRGDRPTRGAGLPQPGPDHAFDVEHWARHMIHHGRTGSKNQYGGIAMDFRFRVHRRGIWGYLLANMLAPTTHSLRSWFMRSFAAIAARPFFYSEAVAAHDQAHPDRPFTPITGPEFTIPRLPLYPPNGRVTEAGTLQHLIDSGIPISWMNHSYTYGLHYIDHYWTMAGPHRDLLRTVDNDRISRLDRWGVPPSLPQWDGWYHPTTDDITRIQTLMHVELHHDSVDCLASSEWMLVGEDPHFRELRSRRRANSPPPNLPTPALSASTSTNVEMAAPSAPDPTPATSTTVAAAETPAAETHVDPVAALSGPLSLAAISASQGPADNNPADPDTEMGS
ncbi:hypothetical protein FPV67DRAFT_1675087 [Lyophyllum atratum]|nr:hypothetical protein FPV67DRAFT_1675087 [Lyophyllum atratum]